MLLEFTRHPRAFNDKLLRDQEDGFAVCGTIPTRDWAAGGRGVWLRGMAS